MKPILAGLLTVVIGAALLFFGSRDNLVKPSGETTSSDPGESPAEQAVRSLIRSADFGDVSSYLDSFDPTLRARLEREIASRGRQAFAEDLQKSARARKAHAVYAAEPETEDTSRVTVETIYPDRNERQTYRVVRSGETWRVAEVATIRTLEPSARYGSPAMTTSPEPTEVPATASPKVGLTVETGDDDDSP